MATVLESEGDRGIRDGELRVRRFGEDFGFDPDDAIVDHSLSGLARYTSGPYQRAAWLMTQIRARICDAAFWAALRDMLAANALGTLTGERVLRGFAPALGETEIDQLIATLPLTTTPSIDLRVTPSGGDREVRVALSDPAHQLLVPLDVTVVDGLRRAAAAIAARAGARQAQVSSGDRCPASSVQRAGSGTLTTHVASRRQRSGRTPVVLPCSTMRLLWFGLSMVGLWSCGGSDENPPDTGGGPRDYDALAYKLVGAFDWSTQQLTARETITLDVPRGLRQIELDTSVEVDRITSTTGTALVFEHDRDAARLTVDLDAVGTAGGAVSFTVAYHVGTSGALLTSDGRDDDPVTSRVVFTNSEPDGARAWLVAHDHPSDRATFAVELTVPADEDVIGNGARIRDDRAGATRVIGYELDQAIPTYLMAFAAGQLDHADRAGTPPLSIWYRRGLMIDAERNLDLVADFMTRFASLIGPYPWRTYSVVLLPSPFGGGMENATITFNAESSGQGNISRLLHAHELAHQWFGDWVTMNDYEDAWFKEGMATLLEAEGDRGIRGGANPRKFGLNFRFDPDDSIVDRSLSGIARYTSGPYQRAAWLMTQIRARIGDDAFWAALRAMLAANALGTLSGERFIRGFAPQLSSAEIDQLIATLERKPTPAIDLAVSTVAGGQQVDIALTDPEHQLLVPIDMTVIDAAGAATVHTLHPGEPRTLVVPPGGYLAPDEAELSPPWTAPADTRPSYTVDPGVYYGGLAPLFAPTTPVARAAFADRSAAHQERTLVDYGLPPLAPEEFAAFYAGLDSIFARRSAELDACFVIRALSPVGDPAPWIAQLPVFLPRPAIETLFASYGACGVMSADTTAELISLVSAPTAATAARLSFLISFDYGPEVSLAQIGSLARSAPSLLLREQALNRLASQTEGAVYSPIADAQPWKQLFQDQLAQAETTARFNIAWRGALGLADRGALPIVAGRLHIYTLSGGRQRQVVCDAFQLTSGDADWLAFRDAAQPWTTLSPPAQAALADPAGCATQLRRAQREPVIAKPR